MSPEQRRLVDVRLRRMVEMRRPTYPFVVEVARGTTEDPRAERFQQYCPDISFLRFPLAASGVAVWMFRTVEGREAFDTYVASHSPFRLLRPAE